MYVHAFSMTNVFVTDSSLGLFQIQNGDHISCLVSRPYYRLHVSIGLWSILLVLVLRQSASKNRNVYTVYECI